MASTIVLANGYKATLVGDHSNRFALCTCHLYQNNLVPTGANVKADFTEANFTGYAAQTMTPGAPFLSGANKGEIDFALITFTQTGNAVTNNIYGYYILDAAGALVWSDRNPNAPVSMNNAGLTYTVAIPYTLDTAP